MRFKITLSIDKTTFGNLLPFNYQYEQSAVIYKILARSDTAFAEWLHGNGYTADKKHFKLFSFSRLQIPKFRIGKEGIEIQSDTMDWYISFLPERSTREFVQGLFREQSFELGNRQARIKCRVQSIEMVAPPLFSETMRFKALSPICIAMNRPGTTVEYISPDHPQANDLILINLTDKYQAMNGKPFALTDFRFNVKTLSTPRSVLTTIKADTPQETKIRGHLCNIEITAPAELMKILYEAGIGSKNSLGFGMLETE